MNVAEDPCRVVPLPALREARLSSIELRRVMRHHVRKGRVGLDQAKQ